MPRTALAETQKAEAIKDLRELCPPGTTLYTVVRSVAPSGMSRVLSVYLIGSGEPNDITADVGYALGLTRKDGWTYNGVRVHGCGMDAGFHLVHALSYALHHGGFTCVGERCPSNDHSNGDRDYTPHAHAEGGYSLRQVWL